MEIAILLFDGLTALDAVGPYEVLHRLPGARVTFVGHRAGVVETPDGALGLRTTAALGDVARTDLLLVPGGRGTRRLLTDSPLLDWIRAVHATSTWTTSVCTGSLVLAAAGLLRGIRATTHALAMDDLARLGAIPVRQRVVVEGRIATSAGVFAGIDLALTLAARIAGDDVAREIRRTIEYDPRPPFLAERPEGAPPRAVSRRRETGGPS